MQNRAKRRSYRAGARTRLLAVVDFFLQRFDILLVPLYFVLVGLQPVEHLLVVSLVAAAHRFLLGQLFLGLRQRFLLSAEFVVQDLAPGVIAGSLSGRVDFGKAWR